jgi:hypothetical protein
MKLQKRLSRIYKNKKYYKYMLVIPEKEIKKAKFKEGDELIVESKEREIKIKK